MKTCPHCLNVLDADEADAAAMTIAEAIKILREYNEWRRGDDSEMIDPAIIGRAIDIVCDYADEKGEL